MTTNEAFKRARAHLLEYGWNQGSLRDYTTSKVCVVGAMSVTCGFEADRRDGVCGYPSLEAFELRGHMYQVLREVLQANPPFWNDAPERTLDEVIAALDKAIAATAPPLDDTPIFQALEDLPAEDYIEALSVLALIPEGELA